MVSRYVLSPLAEADLEEIWVYTAQQWSAAQAEAYTNEIIDTFEDIAADRRVGRPVSVRNGYLKTLVGRHVIFFRNDGGTKTIIRILHQSMDVERHI